MIAFHYVDEETGTITWVPSVQAQEILSALPEELLSQLKEFFRDGFTSLATIFTAIALREPPINVGQILRKVLASLTTPTPD